MMTLSRKERSVVLVAISVAIEHQIKAMENCRQFDLSAPILDTLRQHEQMLSQFEDLRKRLLTDAPTD